MSVEYLLGKCGKSFKMSKSRAGEDFLERLIFRDHLPLTFSVKKKIFGFTSNKGAPVFDKICLFHA